MLSQLLNLQRIGQIVSQRFVDENRLARFQYWFDLCQMLTAIDTAQNDRIDHRQ